MRRIASQKKEKVRPGKEPLREKQVRTSYNLLYGSDDNDAAIGYIYDVKPSYLSNGDPNGFVCKVQCKQTKKKLNGEFCKNRFSARCLVNYDNTGIFEPSNWEIIAPPKNPHLRL